MGEQDLEAIRLRAEAATPGPWDWEWDNSAGGPVIKSADGAYIAGDVCSQEDEEETQANAELLACAREDIPALLAEVERLRGEAILLRAQAEGAASLLLDVQRDCVAAKQVIAQQREVVQTVARMAVGDCISPGDVRLACRLMASEAQAARE